MPGGGTMCGACEVGSAPYCMCTMCGWCRGCGWDMVRGWRCGGMKPIGTMGGPASGGMGP